MRCAAISLGSKSTQWTVKALKNYFDSVDDIDIRKIEVNLGEKVGQILYDGSPLGEYDCVYVKGSYRYATLSQSIVTLLPADCYTPVKAATFTIGHDKLLTQLELQRKGIPMPLTYQAASVGAAKKILQKVSYPIIMKFPHGTQGKGVLFADSLPSASSMLDALTTLQQPFLIQEYVETGGVDIRAIVIGDRVVAAMKRKASSGDVRANIHQGAEGEAIELDPKTKKLAVETAKATGAEICAVDILEGHKGPVVIEINLSPGLQGIQNATKIDVADKIAKFLYERTKELRAVRDEKKGKKVLTELGIPKTDEKHEIISHIDLRGNRILLPEVVTGLSKLEEGDEVIIDASKGRFSVRSGGS